MDGWVAMWLGWESDCMSFLKSFSSSLLLILLAIFYTPMTEYIYIYYNIYIYCNIFTHVSILRNLMLYTLYIICTIYIYICIACLECIICITYTRKHSPCSSTGRSRTLLRSWRTGEFKKHRDEPWLSGVQTWVLTMNNRDLTNNNGIIIEVSWDFFDLIWLLGASEPEPGRFFIAWPFSWENDD